MEKSELPDDTGLAKRIVAESQDYALIDNVLYHYYYPRGKGHKIDRAHRCLAIPHALRDDILRSYHDSLLGGHQGIDRTWLAIRLKFFWPRMHHDIQSYVRTCLPCQQSKRYCHAKKAPLQPIPPAEIFQRWHMDIIGPIKETPEGYKYILLIVDSFSHWSECFALKTMQASEIAYILYNEIICRYGAPKIIVTDRAANFMSQLILELCKIFQITKVQTSSYHPQSNSVCERLNSSIEQTLRIFCDKDQTNWPKLLNSVMAAYRMAPAPQSTAFSPFYLLFGKDMVMPIDQALIPPAQISASHHEHLDGIHKQLKMVREVARENILQAQVRAKQYHDKTAAPPTFEVNGKVWMFCMRKMPGLSPKLCKKWLGPYKILHSHDKYTYTLQRCEDGRQVTSRVHANRLRPYHDPSTRPTNLEVPTDDSTDLNPEEIEVETPAPLDQRQTCTPKPDIEKLSKCANYRGCKWYWVKYKDQSRKEWVPGDKIDKSFKDAFHSKCTLAGKMRKVKPKVQKLALHN